MTTGGGPEQERGQARDEGSVITTSAEQLGEARKTRIIVLGFVEALRNGDVLGLIEAIDDDATWWVPGGLPISGTHRGKIAILSELFSRLPELLDVSTIRVEVGSVVCEGRRAAVEWFLRARTVRGFDYENAYHVLFEIEDGKIMTAREYVDTLRAKEVLFAGVDEADVPTCD